MPLFTSGYILINPLGHPHEYIFQSVVERMQYRGKSGDLNPAGSALLSVLQQVVIKSEQIIN